MPLKSAVPKELINTMMAEIRNEPVIWDEHDDNYDNKYFKKLAFENVGKKIGCTGLAVEKKYKELSPSNAAQVSSQQALLRQLQSGRKNANPGVIGNILPRQSSSSTSKASTVTPANDSNAKSTCDANFLQSLLFDLKGMDDKEKLLLRIAYSNSLLESVQKSTLTVQIQESEEDISCLGEWYPINKKNQAQKKSRFNIVKNEK